MIITVMFAFVSMVAGIFGQNLHFSSTDTGTVKSASSQQRVQAMQCTMGSHCVDWLIDPLLLPVVAQQITLCIGISAVLMLIFGLATA